MKNEAIELNRQVLSTTRSFCEHVLKASNDLEEVYSSTCQILKVLDRDGNLFFSALTILLSDGVIDQKDIMKLFNAFDMYADSQNVVDALANCLCIMRDLNDQSAVVNEMMNIEN